MKNILGLRTMTVAAGIVLAVIATTLPASARQVTQSKSNAISFVAEVWADNWFSLYVNGKLVGEDSVPLATERSFNSETIRFTANYPLTIGIVAKDFTQDSSGLEYIGTPRQQIGDGGIVAQIKEERSGKFVIGTSSHWKALVTSTAPLNSSCVSSNRPAIDCQSSTLAYPSGWTHQKFNASSWANATQFSPAEVGVKEGYFTINWNPAATLVWSSDLKLDNTVLLRTVVSK